MKSTNFIFFGFLVFISPAFGQVNRAQILENKECLYGNWYRVDGLWVDTRDGLRPDLVIYENDSVAFKQELYINPCRFEFNGKLNFDTIYHVSKLFCLDNKREKMGFVSEELVKYGISELSENRLSITTVSGCKTTTYQKEVNFANILQVFTSQKWINSIHSNRVYGFSLESLAKWQVVSDSTYSVWEFDINGVLKVDYGLFADTLKWTLRTDSILQIISETDKKRKKEFKIMAFAPWRIDLTKQVSNFCSEDGFGDIIGNFSDWYKEKEKFCSIVLENNYTFRLFRKTLISNEISLIEGAFEIEANRIVFHPEKYAIRWFNEKTGNSNDVWRFAHRMDFSIPIKYKENQLYLEYKWGNGDIVMLKKQ